MHRINVKFPLTRASNNVDNAATVTSAKSICTGDTERGRDKERERKRERERDRTGGINIAKLASERM